MEPEVNNHFNENENKDNVDFSSPNDGVNDASSNENGTSCQDIVKDAFYENENEKLIQPKNCFDNEDCDKNERSTFEIEYQKSKKQKNGCFNSKNKAWMAQFFIILICLLFILAIGIFMYTTGLSIDHDNPQSRLATNRYTECLVNGYKIVASTSEQDSTIQFSLDCGYRQPELDSPVFSCVNQEAVLDSGANDVYVCEKMTMPIFILDACKKINPELNPDMQCHIESRISTDSIYKDEVSGLYLFKFFGIKNSAIGPSSSTYVGFLLISLSLSFIVTLLLTGLWKIANHLCQRKEQRQ